MFFSGLAVGQIVLHRVLIRTEDLLVLLGPEETDLLSVDQVLLLEHLHEHGILGEQIQHFELALEQVVEALEFNGCQRGVLPHFLELALHVEFHSSLDLLEFCFFGAHLLGQLVEVELDSAFQALGVLVHFSNVFANLLLFLSELPGEAVHFLEGLLGLRLHRLLCESDLSYY